MNKNFENQKGIAGIFIVIGGLALLAVGGVLGSMLPGMMDKKNPTPAVPTAGASPSPEASEEVDESGYIEGKLTYPSAGVPDDVGVCAELATDSNIKFCDKQIIDSKYQTGVGFKLKVEPGVYYVYAYRDEMKAYYNQFVICGLKADCKDRTKIPVIVKAGEIAEAMPEDWYDIPKPTTKVTVTPTLKLIPTIGKIEIDPDILQKITFPSATPTPIVIQKIPTIKLNF